MLAVFLGASWGVIEFVDFLTERAGLPEWTPSMALVFLALGLPVVLGTAFVQEGMGGALDSGGGGPDANPRSPEPSPGNAPPTGPAHANPAASPTGIQGLFTWRNATLGGVGALGLVALAVAAYLIMWATGIGPVGNLIAQGVLGEDEPILLAEFGNTTSDPTLGSVVTEALRVDLASSSVVSLVEVSRVQEAFLRMERDPGSELAPELAREMAVREGIKAVLEGEVGAAGTGYILSATLRATADGSTLATFRRTAGGPDAIIGAIDELSRDVRERVGESLRSIRSGPPLWQVTTSSLEALRKYSQAEQVLARGDEMGGLALLREAVALDSTFAMAYRKEAVVLRNLGIDRSREIEAVEQAYLHRNRLPEKERYLAEAAYHQGVTGDKDALVRAYEAVLLIDPEDPAGLNNLANEYQSMGDLVRAEALYRRNIAGPYGSPISRQNLVQNQLRQGKLEGAREALSAYADAHPEDSRMRATAFLVHVFSGELEAAAHELDVLMDTPGLPAVRRAGALLGRGLLLAVQGRMGEARAAWESAVRESESAGPGPEHSNRMMAIWVDAVVSRDTVRARSSLHQFVQSGRIESVPVEGRAYNFIVELHLTVGDSDGAMEQLRRWRQELPAEFVTPADRANRAFLEVWALSGQNDPGPLLDALVVLRRDVRCADCLEWERPQLLDRSGRAAEARDAWMRLLDRPIGDLQASLTLLPSALEETGRLSEELGDTETAADAYRRFVELWANADPELRPRVERAQARLAALEGS